jgi:hypothetical protein
MVRRSRRAAVLLWALVGAIFLFMAWAANRAYVTATTRDDAASLVESRLCQLLAESAVAEMEAQVGRQLNDPASPLFEVFRAPIYPGTGSGVSLMSGIALKDLEQLLVEKTYEGYGLEHLDCRILSQEPIDSVPYEKQGQVLFEAEFRSPGRVRALRHMSQVVRRFKTTLVVGPRPFANHGFFLLDGTGLYDAEAVGRLRTRALDLTRRLGSKLDELASRQPGTWQEIKQMLPDAGGQVLADVPSADGAVVYGLSRVGAPQDLRALRRDTRGAAHRAAAASRIDAIGA